LLNRPTRLLVVAATFHLFIAIGTYFIGTRGLLPQAIDANTLGTFAPDTQLYLKQEILVVERLRQKDFAALLEPFELHTKIYSLGYWLLVPLFGFTCLSIEPINLFYYLATLVLVYRLGTIVFDHTSGLCAATVAGLWPSLVMHTTQPLRDPLTIMLMLALMVTFSILLASQASMRLIGMGAASVMLLRMARPNVWLLVVAALLIGSGLFLGRLIIERGLRRKSLAALLLILLIGFLSSIQLRGAMPIANEWSAPVERICSTRDAFIGFTVGLRSNIDSEIHLCSMSEIIRYVPRALEIGLFTPFPRMWFETGQFVGRWGRLISGAETLCLYLLYLGAMYGIWIKRKSPAAWFLVLTIAVGAVSIGLVVVNVGTLYRLRYPLDLVVVVLGCGGMLLLINRIRPLRRA
jgi:hypothetical protein